MQTDAWLYALPCVFKLDFFSMTINVFFFIAVAAWQRQTWWLFSLWHLVHLLQGDRQPESLQDFVGHSGGASALCLWSPSPPWWHSTKHSGTLSLQKKKQSLCGTVILLWIKPPYVFQVVLCIVYIIDKYRFVNSPLTLYMAFRISVKGKKRIERLCNAAPMWVYTVNASVSLEITHFTDKTSSNT